MDHYIVIGLVDDGGGIGPDCESWIAAWCYSEEEAREKARELSLTKPTARRRPVGYGVFRVIEAEGSWAGSHHSICYD